jgi:hypothetical protein
MPVEPENAGAPVQPIFLLSLPRSGSTLVQRALATHPEVATTSEPWLMLALLTPLQRGTPGDVGWQRTLNTAVGEFIAELPGGRRQYLDAARRFADELYAEAAGGQKRYFLDKTPPYHWIVDELFDAFPEGRFVFLWRQPLAVAASIFETWCGGHWRPDRYSGPLFSAVENLTASYERHADRAVAVRYEDLLDPAGAAWSRIGDYLDLELDPADLSAFTSVQLNGSTGDPTGTGQYGQLSTEPLRKWRSAVASPGRRFWCRRYLEWIGEARLATMGYDLESLLRELDEVPAERRRLGTDAVEFTTSIAREAVLRRMRGRNAPRTWAKLAAHESSIPVAPFPEEAGEHPRPPAPQEELNSR